MSALGLLPLLLLLCHTFAALEVFAPSPQRTLVGSDVVLPCSFSVDKGTIEPILLAILWYFQGEVVLKFDNKGMTHNPGLSFSVEAARNGNASLSLSSVSLSDGGTYRCVVIYSPEHVEKDISFEVQATPVILIPNKAVRRNRKNTLYCKVTGFFPPDIAIHWLVDEEVPKKQMMGKPQLDRDGTYWVNSTMIITPTDEHRNRTVSCRIQHASLQEPLQENFQLVYEDETSETGTIVACVIVILLISAVMFGIFFWWKQRKDRRKVMEAFMVKDIEGPSQLLHGEEATLCCTATDCTGDIRVTWLEKRAGQVREIPQSQPVDAGEKEKLLETSYVIISQKEGLQYSSSLRFIPYMEIHKDVALICRFIAGQRSEEKTFRCKAIYGKPQLLQPVSRSVFVPGEMKYVLSLEKFCPRKIGISWTCGIGESQEKISSSESLTDNPDGTSNVSSEVRIPEALLRDPRFIVLANWEHESLGTPGYKELSVRDKEYPWIPIVEEIQTPRFIHNAPVTLQCNISEYFPDAVTVTWLRRKDQELCEEADAVYIPNIQSHRDTDNTYSYTASLTIVPTVTVHQGAEYICQVDHPSLVTPIEKGTGTLNVLAKPHMADPIKITVADSSRVLFSLSLQAFWPKDIHIDWHYENNMQKFPLVPKNKMTEHRDCTADVTSECSIPTEVFIHPEVRVHVTWKHESMDEPETRSLSIRDQRWRPEVGDINIPRLGDKKKVSLTCDICSYFPGYLTVTWYKKKDGNVTELGNKLLSFMSNYTVSLSKKGEKDQNFTHESCLTFTPSIRTDQGAEFICRVGHPNLEQPLERSTGPLDIGLKENKAHGVTKKNRSPSQQSTSTSTSSSEHERVDQIETGEEVTEQTAEGTEI